MRRLVCSPGQVIPVSVLFTLAVLLPALAFGGVGQLLLVRAGSTEAADAAALAAAQQAVVTKRVDALGNVYGYSVGIDQQRARTAAWQQWQADEGLLLGASTAAFAVRVDNSPPPGAPATVDVVAQVAYSDFLLALAGVGRQHTLTVQAVAGTCGSTAWPGSAPPWCTQ